MSLHAAARPTLISRVRRLFKKPQQCAPTTAFPITPDWSDSYDADLLRFLQQELARVGRVRASHWVMSEGWYHDVCAIKSPNGRAYLESIAMGRVELLGIPVQVTYVRPNMVPTLIPYR